MTQEEYAEWAYSLGLMPEWVYSQVNGKSPIENYKRQMKIIKDKLHENDDEVEVVE